MTATGLFGGEARHLGKSARTRARLMDAAVQLFSRQGFEAASVNEIAKLAEVANGTFYAHFRDKDEIATAVAFGVAEQVVSQIHAAMADIEDAVLRSSLGTRRFIDLAASHPDWGGALVRALNTFQALRERVAGYLRTDFEMGVRQGAFTVEIDDFVIDTFAAMTASALHGRLQGRFGDDAGSRVAELQLRMLGVDPDRARDAAWRPIAPISLLLAAAPGRAAGG